MKTKSFLFVFTTFCVISTVFCSSGIANSNFFNDYDITNLISTLEIDITIPDDYITIQEGIDNANPGEVIFVKPGTYKENILINIENLTIRGNNKINTVIDGGKLLAKDTVQITAPNVTISGFTIKNGWNINEHYWDLSGIRINGSNANIIGNIITENRQGICAMSKTYNHLIKDNEFISDGLMFSNYVYNHYMDIEDFRHTVENNTINDKPLYFFEDRYNFVVPEDAGQVILVNCSNAIVQNLVMEKIDFGITLAGCNECIVKNNTIDDTDGELITFFSENITIENNKIGNSLHGICLDYFSKNCIVRNNEVYGNWIGISSITGSQNNKIYANTLYDNKAGIEIATYYLPLKSHNHEIYENEISGSNNGILISGASQNLSVFNNTICKNIFGINIKESKGNNISENILFKNIVSARFSGCKENIWYHNHWNRPRIFPKVIFGSRNIGKIPVPWINIDKNPLGWY